MREDCSIGPALYARVAGCTWSAVDEAIRAVHLDDSIGALHLRGWFAIRHGERRLARWIVQALRMPAEAERVETRVVVTRSRSAEKWRRRFGNQRLVTVQRERPGGLLAERFGPLELRFRLRAERGSLVYEQAGTFLGLGPLSLRLPRRFSPRVEAREKAIAGSPRVRVAVRIVLPVVGLLLSYSGEIEPEGFE